MQPSRSEREVLEQTMRSVYRDLDAARATNNHALANEYVWEIAQIRRQIRAAAA